MEMTPLIRSSWSTMPALWVVGLLLAPAGTAASPLVRTVSGDVEAVNLAAAPQVIVVKVILPTKEDMIVGATVAPDVPITRGKKRASLA
ncbi:MAG: hypothetical protein HZB35_07615, partial [Nitrospirae bacterium]|nr:hypothetical protein [Nitrospirota bacterium]